MKLYPLMKIAPAGLVAGMLMAVGAATTAMAAAPALNGQLVTRPLSPQDIKDYTLTGLQGASGLTTIGVGQPAYLETLVNLTIAPSNIVSVTWGLTNLPVGSLATLLPSPLGSNVPTYKMADRTVSQVPSRMLLRPDVKGQYTVTASIVTATSGSTNLALVITAGTYVGAETCAFCHGADSFEPDKVTPWSMTKHATMLTKAIDGLKSDHYSKNCISCHTVGYDTKATNGGFDDVAALYNYTFPAVLTNGNWAAMPDALKNLSNIQCENCHGPGSQHVASRMSAKTNTISVSWAAGDCAQCHDSKNTHVKNAEWNNSRHAVATRTPSGPNRLACVRCHTAAGFAGYIENAGTTNKYATNYVYEAITCAACHDPHDATNDKQLRADGIITLDDGTSVTNAGLGGFCMNCHQSRNGSVNNSIDKYPLLQQTWNGGSSFGVHDNNAADMLEGVNGYTYGKVIPSSAHRMAISNTCVACHMQTLPTTDPGFTKAGGHTMKMSYEAVSGGVTNVVDVTTICAQCHGPVSTFDMVVTDYNGDGIIEGVQTEVQKLLNKLSTLLPSSTYVASGNYVADGLVKSPSVKTNWPSKFLKAAYNFQFVNNDLSKGVHNAPYAVGLLRASIGDLTGDSNSDGLPDWWQIQYFGSVTNASAAPNYAAAGDGVPNWLKFALGISPFTPGASVPGGYVFGPSLNNPAATNTVQIYNAAEIVFDTVVGKTYQVQSIMAVGGEWQNVGGSIAGNGRAISYLTQSRTNKHEFFRVVSAP